MSRRIAGVLLAGGLSRRMGGVDKALVALAGRPLIAHALDRLAPQIDRLLVNANGDVDRFAPLGLPVVADETADFPGPLAGILAALHWVERHAPGTQAVVSVSADAPFVPSDLVARLDQALTAHPDARAAVAQSQARRHHVIGLWRLSAAAEIAAALARGERKVEAMVDRLGAVAVPFPDCLIGTARIDPFFNVNTPEDLAAAERILARASPSLESPPPLWGRAREGGTPDPSLSGEGNPFVVGVAGWKNSGKTTLVERLVAELARRGYRISTVKHTHHAIDSAVEPEGADSARHRQAGAHQVMLVAPNCWIRTGADPASATTNPPGLALAEALARLAPADIVLVEGWKHAPIPKIEVRRAEQDSGPPLTSHVPDVRAVASDLAAAQETVPVLARDDIQGLTAVVLDAGGLPPRRQPHL